MYSCDGMENTNTDNYKQGQPLIETASNSRTLEINIEAVKPCIDVETLCRLCCTSGAELHDIFEPIYNLHSKLTYIPVKVRRGDRLPQRVCVACRDRVLQLHQFCADALRAQQRLINMLEAVEGEEIKPEPAGVEQATQTECDPNNRPQDHNANMELGLTSRPDNFGQGPYSRPDNFGLGSNSCPDNFGLGPNPRPDNFGLGSIPCPDNFGLGPNSRPNNFGLGSDSRPDNFGLGPNSRPDNFGLGPNPCPDDGNLGLGAGHDSDADFAGPDPSRMCLVTVKQEVYCPMDETKDVTDASDGGSDTDTPLVTVKREKDKRKTQPTPQTNQKPATGPSYLEELKKRQPDLQITVKSEHLEGTWAEGYQYNWLDGFQNPSELMQPLKQDPETVFADKLKAEEGKECLKGLQKNLNGNVTIKKVKPKKMKEEDEGIVPKTEGSDSDDGIEDLHEYLQRHPKKQRNKDLYTCCICLKTTENRENCLLHYSTHSAAGDPEPPPAPPAPPKGRCGQCRKRLGDETWPDHWRRHWLRDRPSYTCKLCLGDLNFWKVKDIVEHGISYHAKENDAQNNANYRCDLCTATFMFMKKLLNHRLVRHPDAGPAKPRCARCTFVAKNILQLRRHVKRAHDANAHLCPQCGKTFTEAHHLRRHLILHTGEKPYKCKYCGKAFASSSYLPDHERTHTGEKPHQCSVCGRGFSQRSSRTTHERSVHSQLRPFVCQLCGRGFAAKGFLTTHQKTACI